MKMGLLIFVRNLLLALCLFLVLGFLYYSAWKLHLLQWEDSSKYGHSLAYPQKKPPVDQLWGFPVAAMLSDSSEMSTENKLSFLELRLRNHPPLLLL